MVEGPRRPPQAREGRQADYPWRTTTEGLDAHPQDEAWGESEGLLRVGHQERRRALGHPLGPRFQAGDQRRRPRQVTRVLVTGSGGLAGVNFVRALRASSKDYYIVGTDFNKYHILYPDVDARYLTPGTATSPSSGESRRSRGRKRRTSSIPSLRARRTSSPPRGRRSLARSSCLPPRSCA